MASAVLEASTSREQRIWEANFATCCLLLEQSYLGVATKSFQAGLIGFQLMDAVTNETLIVTRKQQALTLVTTLYRQMEATPTEASNVMKNFLEILEKDASLGNLRKQLGSNRIEAHTFYFLHSVMYSYACVYMRLFILRQNCVCTKCRRTSARGDK